MQISPYSARVVSYWSLTEFTKLSAADGATVQELREKLADIVNQQLMSDVPVGSFFSAM